MGARLANLADLFFRLLRCKPIVFHLRVNSRAHPLKRNASPWKSTSEPVKNVWVNLWNPRPYGVGRYWDMAVSPTRSHLLWLVPWRFLFTQNSQSESLKAGKKRTIFWPCSDTFFATQKSKINVNIGWWSSTLHKVSWDSRGNFFQFVCFLSAKTKAM